MNKVRERRIYCRAGCGRSRPKRGTKKTWRCILCANKARSERLKLPAGVSAFRSLLRVYRSAAQLRGQKFFITESHFAALIKRPCYYCGAPPAGVHSTSSRSFSAADAIVYSGIDRINNRKGYVLGNVVPCCKRCNWSKRDMPLKEFFRMVALIHSRHRKACCAARSTKPKGQR